MITLVMLLTVAGALTPAPAQTPPPRTVAFTAESPWMREGQAGKATAGYTTFANGEARELAIVGLRSSVADAVEMHEMVQSGSMMRMKRIDAIVVPARGRKTLEPGGLHLMFIGLTKQVSAGETVRVTVTLKSGEELNVDFPVRKRDGN